MSRSGPPEAEEDRLASGFAHAARHAEPESPQDAFLTWVRAQARFEMESRGHSYESVSETVHGCFVGSIEDAYSEPLEQMRHRVSIQGDTAADVARRLGVHRATVGRWLKGNQSISFSHFAIIAAASGAEFSSGHTIAADAFVSGLDTLCRALDRHRNECFAEEVLVLYHVFRCPQWWQALLDADQNALASAADFIQHGVSEYTACTQQWTPQSIGRLLKAWQWEWSLIEAILPYEWF